MEEATQMVDFFASQIPYLQKEYVMVLPFKE